MLETSLIETTSVQKKVSWGVLISGGTNRVFGTLKCVLIIGVPSFQGILIRGTTVHLTFQEGSLAGGEGGSEQGLPPGVLAVLPSHVGLAGGWSRHCSSEEGEL